MCVIKSYENYETNSHKIFLGTYYIIKCLFNFNEASSQYDAQTKKGEKQLFGHLRHRTASPCRGRLDTRHRISMRVILVLLFVVVKK